MAKPHKCPNCNGDGVRMMRDAIGNFTNQTCPSCDGKGIVWDYADAPDPADFSEPAPQIWPMPYPYWIPAPVWPSPCEVTFGPVEWVITTRGTVETIYVDDGATDRIYRPDC